MGTNGVDNLTPKQRRFVNEYLLDFNGTQAAIRAGYSKHSANSIAAEYLAKPNVESAVQKWALKKSEKVDLNTSKVLGEIAKIAFQNFGRYVEIVDGQPRIDWDSLTEADWATISEFVIDEYVDGKGKNARAVKRTRVKFHSKTSALELLGKYLSLWVERHQHEFSFDLTSLSDSEFNSFGTLLAKAAVGAGSPKAQTTQNLQLLPGDGPAPAGTLPETHDVLPIGEDVPGTDVHGGEPLGEDRGSGSL
jgi:phage terminase small subunit